MGVGDDVCVGGDGDDGHWRVTRGFPERKVSPFLSWSSSSKEEVGRQTRRGPHLRRHVGAVRQRYVEAATVESAPCPRPVPSPEPNFRHGSDRPWLPPGSHLSGIRSLAPGPANTTARLPS
ncbi:hypothetical protein MTO96_023521 [Rhipicephalus appendiculatus]